MSTWSAVPQRDPGAGGPGALRGREGAAAVAVHEGVGAEDGAFAPTVLPPLALYLHVPWCVRKCPYCDFNSHPLREGIPEAAFVAAVAADLRAEARYAAGRPVESLFIGGGTPSLLSPAAIAALIAAVRAAVVLADEAEITLEANPGATEVAALLHWRAAGINRVSIGVQSLDPRGLAVLGRIHDVAAARTTVAAAVRHFERVNADLIYGWPGQTPEGAAAEVQALVELGVTHLSAYQLTIEPNTPFAAAPPPGLPDEERLAEIEAAIHEVLLGAGFDHYEVSAFARPGHACRHNRTYWTYGDYLGVGPGAHGKCTVPGQGIMRRRKHAHPNAYLAAAASGAFLAEAWWVPVSERPFEFFLNALRLRAGVPRARFTERTGLPFAVVAERWAQLAARGLVEDDPARLRTTSLGWRHLNGVLEPFLAL